MDSDEAASGLDIPLESDLLVSVKHVAGGVEENYRTVGREGLFGEHGWVVGRIDRDPSPFSLKLHGLKARLNIFMTIFRGSREYENFRGIGGEVRDRGAAGDP
jgi:hypothetical protein